MHQAAVKCIYDSCLPLAASFFFSLFVQRTIPPQVHAGWQSLIKVNDFEIKSSHARITDLGACSRYALPVFIFIFKRVLRALNIASSPFRLGPSAFEIEKGNFLINNSGLVDYFGVCNWSEFSQSQWIL